MLSKKVLLGNRTAHTVFRDNNGQSARFEDSAREEKQEMVVTEPTSIQRTVKRRLAATVPVQGTRVDE